MASADSAGLPDIARTLSEARAERKQEVAITLFQVALRLCDAWYSAAGGTDALILRAQTYAELAYEQSTPAARTASCRDALDTLRPQASHTPEIADAYALLAVDCFQDLFNNLNFRSRLEILRAARDRLDQASSGAMPPAISSVLLSRKSSVLRHLALAEVAPDSRLRRLKEAVRCAALATQRERNKFTLLELGLSGWALSEGTIDLYRF